MKRWLIILGIVVVLLAGGYFAMQQGLFSLPMMQGSSSNLEQTTSDTTQTPAASPVVVDGRLMPVQRADLSLATGGIVAELLVQEGEQVARGQLLVRLNSNQQQVAIARAQADLQRAEAARLELAAPPRAEEVAQIEAALSAAQARYTRLTQASLPGDIAAAEAALGVSQASLNKVLEGASEQQLIAAQAEVNAQQAQLDLLLAGPRSEAIAMADADIAAATAALQQAFIALGDTELYAPFAGTVAALEIEIGEQAAPGVALLQLADLSTWEIETEDLTELDVVGITAGMPVTLNFDAIPELEMGGVVKRIRPIGEDNRGDIVYTVVIEPEQQDARFLWNMTTIVTLDNS